MKLYAQVLKEKVLRKQSLRLKSETWQSGGFSGRFSMDFGMFFRCFQGLAELIPVFFLNNPVLIYAQY